MKLIIKVLTVFIFSITLCACSSDSKNSSTSTAAPVITIKTNPVSAAGGSQFVSIDAGGDWELYSSADWVSFGTTRGSGSADVLMTCSANTDKAGRTATITVTSSGKSNVAHLSQKGVGGSVADPYITLESSEYRVSAAGGMVVIGVQANVNYTTSVEEAAKSWISPAQNPLVFNISENPGKERRGNIVITSSDGTIKVSAAIIQNEKTNTPSANVVTGSAQNITKVGATLSASYSNASSSLREAGFEWGRESGNLAYTVQVTNTPSGLSGSFSYGLTDLGEGQTYYYRAYVVVQEGDNIQHFYGNTLSFTTDNSPVVTSGQPGWFELPAMNVSSSGGYKFNANKTTDYYAFHLCPDLYNGNGKQARNYTVCYSAEHHCPVWIAAPRHNMYVGSSGRSDAYKIDPDMPADIQYKSTSAGSSSGCNRGHMLGSAERTATSAVNRQVFYMSNIAPQLSTTFNGGGGGWNLLEDWVDKQVCSDTLYVVIGCYFDKFTDGYGNTVSPKKITYAGRSDVSFPTMYYYILMRTKSGSSGKSLKDCSASEIKCAAFVRAHTGNLKGQKPSSKEMMSVADLEKLTGYTYFPSVPNVVKSSFNASDWGL